MKRMCFCLTRKLAPVFATLAIFLLLMAGGAWGAVLPPLGLEPLNQIAIQEPANLYNFVKNKPAAIQLGKALFWDMQVGSDGMTACATCHFSAGTDNRAKNTLHPGRDGIFNVRGVNQTVLPVDFPFHKRQPPVDFQFSLTVRDSDDAVGSQGVRLKQFVDIVIGSPYDIGTDIPDPIFTLNGVNVRAVTGRNTPSVINAAFNFTNFWDGRASAFFNGVNPFGPLDTSAGVWFNNNGTLVKQPVSIMFASLASQATGPPLSDVEMSFRGRTFPQLGRKMLSLTPLGLQFVHTDDSELGADSRATLQPDGTLAGSKGLSISYSQMIKDAFQNNLWNSNQLTPDGFTQMEANFSLYWGLAIQLYEATLIADDTPFDRFLGGDTTAMTDEQQEGMNIFFGAGRCDLCHAGSEQTNASHGAAAFLNNASQLLMEVMPVASGKQILYDNGFNNTAVTKTNDDIGRAADSPFLNVLTGLLLPLSFSDQAILQAQVPTLLPFAAPILPAQVPNNFPVANNGAFKVPGMRNIELTAPYMHNGSMLTLDEMIEFYTRGGNFPNANKADLDINIAEIPAIQGEPAVKAAMVAFMKAMTDERVRNEIAPFDHPEIFIPNGDSVNDTDLIHLPATGITGIPVPVVVTVTPGFNSPQAVGTTILFTANATGGSGAFEYQFLLTDTAGTVTVVSPFSAVNSWNWLTSGVPGGTYTITVQARNATGTSSPTGIDAEASVNYVLTTVPATGASITPNLPSPQPASVSGGITFTAAGQGGTGNYEYQFWFNNGTVWTMVQDYSNTSTWNWITAGLTPGTYRIQANVRSAGSSALPYEAATSIDFVLNPSSATDVNLVATPSSPITAGPTVTFNAEGVGGTGSYEYQFWFNNGTVWTMVQDYSNTNSWNWNTAGLAPGTYQIQANVRSAGSTALPYEVAKTIDFVINPSSATDANLAATPSGPIAAGPTVTFNAEGVGGTGSYEYQFWFNNGTGWTMVQDYSNTNSWNWNTAGLAPGTYQIQANVRSAGSTALPYEVARIIDFVITPSPATDANLAATPSSPIAAGPTVTFNAGGVGGAGSYEYQFWFNNGAGWTMVQDYSNTNTWNWNTAGLAPGNYAVQVNVRSAGSTVLPYEAANQVNYILLPE